MDVNAWRIYPPPAIGAVTSRRDSRANTAAPPNALRPGVKRCRRLAGEVSHADPGRGPAWTQGEEVRGVRGRLAGLEPRGQDRRRGARDARGVPRTLSADRRPG